MRHWKLIIFLMLLSLFANQALAQSNASVSGDKTPRTEVLNFEDELVEGKNTKPELFYLLQKKNFNYKRLIKLRENFIPESKRSFENLQMNRGDN